MCQMLNRIVWYGGGCLFVVVVVAVVVVAAAVVLSIHFVVRNFLTEWIYKSELT